MNRRAFLAGLVGLPVAAKVPAAWIFRKNGKTRLIAEMYLESKQYSAGEIAKIYRLMPWQLTILEAMKAEPGSIKLRHGY